MKHEKSSFALCKLSPDFFMKDSTQNVRFHVKSHVTKHMFRWTITAKCYVKFHVMLSSVLCTNISRYQTWVLRVISTKITKSHVTKLDMKWNVKVNVKDNVKVNVKKSSFDPCYVTKLDRKWNVKWYMHKKIGCMLC